MRWCYLRESGESILCVARGNVKWKSSSSFNHSVMGCCFFKWKQNLFDLQTAISEQRAHRLRKHSQRSGNAKLYNVCTVLKCYKKFFKKGKVGKWESCDISITYVSNIVAINRKSIPSFEPTVLKYPAENPPLKAPWNRLYLPFSSLTVWSWRGIGFFGLSPKRKIFWMRKRKGNGGLEKKIKENVIS